MRAISVDFPVINNCTIKISKTTFYVPTQYAKHNEVFLKT